MTAGWPVDLDGLTEAVVTTPAPDSGWHLAALGLRPGEPVTARTWGRTRTRANFERVGEGVVQFVSDPVVFVEAALAAPTVEEPVVEAADAWVEVTVDRLDAGVEAGTEWVDWGLEPGSSGVEREAVPTIERGFNAVVEATVCASRLGVPGYDRAELTDRLARHRAVIRRCGGPRDREAMERLETLVDA